MTTSFTEGKHPGEFVIREWDQNFNREVRTLLSGQKLVDGTVLELSTTKIRSKQATVTTDDEFTVPVEGILVGDWDASATGTNADIPNVPYLKRGPAIVRRNSLTLPSGQEDLAVEGLLALGIVARED
jgi:hypothetical protein